MVSDLRKAPRQRQRHDEDRRRRHDGDGRHDGNAHFHDKPSVDVHLFPTLPSTGEIRKDIGKGLESWEKDPYKDQRNGPVQDLPEHQRAVEGACDHYGSECGAPPNGPSDTPAPAAIPIIGGRFEITDYLMKKFGVGDPYAARKKELLDATFDERAQKGAAHRAEQLDRSGVIMRENLEALWRASADAGERKEALFEMWDECAEGDDAAGIAGERARKVVVGWIRAKLPAGSAGAFTAADLAQLDARKSSKQPFAPYTD